MKFASFDLEIAKDYQEGDYDVPISCAACALDSPANGKVIKRWEGIPFMNETEARKIVDDLIEIRKNDYTIVTWNGCAFDFRVLANACKDHKYTFWCGNLAMHHIDLMFYVVCHRGHFLGLDKALVGNGIKTKTHEVTLKNGQTITDMSGGIAPQMWRDGEYEAVKTYLDGDVERTLELAKVVFDTNRLCWISNRGMLNRVYGQPKSVTECFLIQKPDTSWMTNPPKREGFVSWIPEWEKYL